MRFQWSEPLLQAIGGREWINKYEVEERFHDLIPPEAVHRRKHNYTRRHDTFRSWVFNSVVRHNLVQGRIERDKPWSTAGINIGFYNLRLTKKGESWLKNTRVVQCMSCLQVRFSHYKGTRYWKCNHCGSSNRRVVSYERNNTGDTAAPSGRGMAVGA